MSTLTQVKSEIAGATLSILSRIGSDDREDTTIPVGGIPCLRELIEVLGGEFLARVAGFVWWGDPSVKSPLCIAIPFIREQVLRRCLKTKEVKAALGGFLIEPKRKYAWVIPDRGQSPFEEFLAIRVPLLYDRDAAGGVGIICIVDRIVRSSLRETAPGSDIEPLCHIVAYWAARMVHQRMELHWLSERCMKNPGGANLQAMRAALLEATKALRRTLTLEDFVAVVDALRATESRGHGQKFTKTFLGTLSQIACRYPG